MTIQELNPLYHMCNLEKTQKPILLPMYFRKSHLAG